MLNLTKRPDVEAAALDSERIKAELLFELIRRARPVLVSGLALIAIFIAIFWDFAPRHDLILWAALGLFLSLNFVRRWGGDITVSSTPGAGSTFDIALPAIAAAAEQQPA